MIELNKLEEKREELNKTKKDLYDILEFLEKKEEKIEEYNFIKVVEYRPTKNCLKKNIQRLDEKYKKINLRIQMLKNEMEKIG